MKYTLMPQSTNATPMSGNPTGRAHAEVLAESSSINAGTTHSTNTEQVDPKTASQVRVESRTDRPLLFCCRSQQPVPFATHMWIERGTGRNDAMRALTGKYNA